MATAMAADLHRTARPVQFAYVIEWIVIGLRSVDSRKDMGEALGQKRIDIKEKCGMWANEQTARRTGAQCRDLPS